VLVGTSDNEDAAVLRFPAGKAMVQTVDFFTPIVNNPYWFGQIAAANSLSDVYAMGGEPWSAMNIVCFPIKSMSREILREILKGGCDKVREAGAVLVGGHSVEDEEIKYGLAVTGAVDPEGYTANRNLRPGDHLLLTKPLGTGVLATALKARWAGHEELEKLLYHWASRLNSAAGHVIRELGLQAATDVTGFGLGGHVLEMARASKARVELWLDRIPMLEQALELAGMGMLPAGSFANKHYCESMVDLPDGLGQDETLRVDMVFDAQTSGGMVLAVPEAKLEQARRLLQDRGELAEHVGRVLPEPAEKGRLSISRAP
jgi:selenide,water dikinase